MAIKKLKMAGQFDSKAKVVDEGSLVKECLLCYEGTHESMDGPVTVTPQQLESIVTNYNSVLAQSSVQNGGKPHDRHCAPVQVDHDESAMLTVGRLRNALRMGIHTLLSGINVKGLFGPVTILGKENVERANDGRWSTVSLSADFEKGIIEELTITGFPAAKEASLLSTKNTKGVQMGAKKKDACVKHLMGTVGMSREEAEQHYSKMNADQKEKLAKFAFPSNEHEVEPKGDPEKGKEGELAADKKPAEDKLGEKKPGEEKKEGEELHGDACAEGGGESQEKKPFDHAGFQKHLSDLKSHLELTHKGHLESLEKLHKAVMAAGAPEVHVDIDSHKGDASDNEDGATPKPGEGALGEKPAGADAPPANIRQKYMAMLAEKHGIPEHEAAVKMAHLLDTEVAEGIKKHEEEKLAAAKPKEEGDGKVEPTAGTPQKKVGNEENPKDHLEKDKKEPPKEGEKKPADEKEPESEKKKELKKLMAGVTGKQAELSRKLKTERIKARFSRLKAAAKITPAEIKGVDFEALSNMSDKDCETTIKLYEGREPVVFVGLQGSSQAVNLSKILNEKKVAEIREEAISDMPFTAKHLASKRVTDKQPLPLGAFESKKVSDEKVAIEKLMDSGKIEDAKRLMRKRYEDMSSLSAMSEEGHEESEDRIKELEKQLSEMADAMKKMSELV